MRRVPLLLIACCALAAACSPPPAEEPLVIETVDVEPPIDEGLSTEGDQQAAERAVAIFGQLPGGIPPDLPIYLPSSVVDFGAAAGRPYVDLDTRAAPDTVRGWLGERLPGAGWSVDAVGADLVRASKGGRRASYRLTDLRPGTRIRLEYDPR